GCSSLSSGAVTGTLPAATTRSLPPSRNAASELGASPGKGVGVACHPAPAVSRSRIVAPPRAPETLTAAPPSASAATAYGVLVPRAAAAAGSTCHPEPELTKRPPRYAWRVV